MSTLVELRSDVSANLSHFDNNFSVWGPAVIDKFINSAIKRIQQEGSFNWFFNTAEYSANSVISQREYDLPSDFARMKESTFKYDLNSVMTEVDYEYLYATQDDLDQEGTPTLYYINDDKFGLFHVPDEVKSFGFLYWKKVGGLVNDSDDSGLPEDFDDAIVAYAEYLCWKKVKSKKYKEEAYELYRMEVDELYWQYLDGFRDESNMTIFAKHPVV